MRRFVVLLRGVNVGKGNRVPMAELRQLLEALGYMQVRTLLNSGNTVCSGPGGTSARHAKTVHDALLEHFGRSVAVVVKSAQEFRAIVDANPLQVAEQEYSRLLVAFAQDRHTVEALSVIAPLVRASERFVIGDLAAYLLRSDGVLHSQAASALLGKLGAAVTTRNWTTVLKLQKLLLNGK